MGNYLKYLKSKMIKNIEPFDEWFDKIMNKTYLFHGWDISNLEAKIQEIKPMVKSKFNDETRQEVEYYLLHGEFAKYRKEITAADFFPLAKDFPDLIENYFKKTVFEKKVKDYKESFFRQAKAEAYEEAYRDLLTQSDESKNLLIKTMKNQMSFQNKFDEINEENKKLRRENENLKKKIEELRLLGEVAE